jgi:hypothetical protein
MKNNIFVITELISQKKLDKKTLSRYILAYTAFFNSFYKKSGIYLIMGKCKIRTNSEN